MFTSTVSLPILNMDLEQVQNECFLTSLSKTFLLPVHGVLYAFWAVLASLFPPCRHLGLPKLLPHLGLYYARYPIFSDSVYTIFPFLFIQCNPEFCHWLRTVLFLIRSCSSVCLLLYILLRPCGNSCVVLVCDMFPSL